MTEGGAGGGRSRSHGERDPQHLPVARRADGAGQRFHRCGWHAAPGASRRRGRGNTPPPPPRAILSYEFWQRRFGANPSIVGTVVALGQQRIEVVGVLGARVRAAVSARGQHRAGAGCVDADARRLCRRLARQRRVARHRTAPRWRDVRAGAGGSRRDRRRSPPAVCDQGDGRLPPASRADAPGSRRRRAAGDPDADGCRRAS